MGSAHAERTPLLPTTTPPSAPLASDEAPLRFWTLPRVALLALVLLNAASSAALWRVSSLSSELLVNLQQLPQPSLRQSAEPAVPSLSQSPGASTSGARVLIVYSNGTHLSKLARAVEKGVLRAVAQPEQLRTKVVDDASFEDDVLWADAVILGSHVVNANVEPKMSAFMTKWDFSKDLSRKVGAAFVTGGGMSSGEELTMVNLLHSMLIFRMVIVGGERWTSAFGASAIVSEGPFQPLSRDGPKHQDFPSSCYPSSPDELNEMFKDKAEGLGHRVASVASALITGSSS